MTRLTVAIIVAAILGPTAARGASLDAIVSQTIRKNYQALHGCYRKTLAVDRDRAGTIFIRVTLGRAGIVSGTKVARDELGAKGVAACVAKWIRGWTFSGAEKAGASAGNDLLIPITFAAAKKQYAIRIDDVPSTVVVGKTSVQLLLHKKNVGASRASMLLWSIDDKEINWPGLAGKDQALIVLAGRARVRGIGRWRKLGPRDAVALAPGKGLQLRLRKGPLRVVHVIAPGGGEQELIAALKKGGPSKSARGKIRVVSARKTKALVLAKGKLRITPLLHKGILGHGRFYLGLLKAKKGLSVAEHAHLSEAELLQIITGRGAMQLNGLGVDVGPGQATYLPHGHAHRLEVKQDLDAVQVYAPAGPEQRFFRGAAKR